MADDDNNVVQNFECVIFDRTYTLLRWDNHDVELRENGVCKSYYECDNGDTDTPKLRACDTFNDIRDTLRLLKTATEVNQNDN